ncbi:alpha/beta fold hydrolase [Nocardiopsis sp. ARC36]
MERKWSTGRSAPLTAVVLLAGSLVAAAPAAAEDRNGGPVPEVEWGACPADVPTGPYPLECGTVPVPVDYGDPGGAGIDIMVSRLASEVPGERRGILMLNPGGPGGSGLSMPADLAALGAPASLSNTYDLIGMDPRGVGHSAPVSCGFTTDQAYYGNIPPYAVDDAAITDQAVTAEAVADRCAANDTDGLLPHISTANTARDMDRIREALGEEKTGYFGVSYGSALGAAYASLFPERTDRIVLDSNIGDTFLGYDGLRQFGAGFEEAFPTSPPGWRDATAATAWGTRRSRCGRPTSRSRGGSTRRRWRASTAPPSDSPPSSACTASRTTPGRRSCGRRWTTATRARSSGTWTARPVAVRRRPSPWQRTTPGRRSSRWPATTPSGRRTSTPTGAVSPRTGSGTRCTARPLPTSCRAPTGTTSRPRPRWRSPGRARPTS